jgi:cell division protein FtsQ
MEDRDGRSDERLEQRLDLEPEPGEEQPFLRRRRKVEVRRSRLDLRRLKLPLLGLAAFTALAAGAWFLRSWALEAAAFRLAAENLEVSGLRHVPRGQVLERFAGDLQRSVFAIPLTERRAMIEQLPWVERADVARLWPARLKVVVHERRPVAFVRMNQRLALIDGGGQLLDLPPRGDFSFPIAGGISEKDSPEERALKMKLYNAVIADFDREGQRYSLDLSEVHVGDLEDAQVVVVDTAILLHLGDTRFLERYKTYLQHIQEWRRSFEKIGSIDLRYERQAVVSPVR